MRFVGHFRLKNMLYFCRHVCERTMATHPRDGRRGSLLQTQGVISRRERPSSPHALPHRTPLHDNGVFPLAAAHPLVGRHRADDGETKVDVRNRYLLSKFYFTTPIQNRRQPRVKKSRSRFSCFQGAKTQKTGNPPGSVPRRNAAYRHG